MVAAVRPFLMFQGDAEAGGSEAEIGRLASALSDGGTVLMPLDDHGFRRRFAWVNDRYGVSWQLNLP